MTTSHTNTDSPLNGQPHNANPDIPQNHQAASAPVRTTASDVPEAAGAGRAISEQTAEREIRRPAHGGLPRWTLRDILVTGGIGIGCASFFFLVVQVVLPGTVPMTPLSVVSLFVMGAVMGQLTYVFHLDGTLPNLALYAIHCILILAVAACWTLVNGWWNFLKSSFPIFVAIFAIIYLVISAAYVLTGVVSARHINSQLHQRTDGKHGKASRPITNERPREPNNDPRHRK